jgi:rfaE bifunctional protein kinase chain/domain
VKSILTRDPELSTTVKLRVVGQQQQLLRIDFERPPSHAALAAKMDEYERQVDAADAIVLSDYGKGGLERVQEMIAAARRHGKPVLVDPKGDDYARYRGATVLTPNRGEFREVAGRWSDEADLTRRAQKLRAELELDALIVTRSEEGMSLFTAKESHHEATVAREVYDVSGAGDTVIGVLALMVAAGADLHAAMRVANHAAGVVVAKLGTAVVHPGELAASLAGREARSGP